MGVIEHTPCAACGKPVSYTDEGGCVGTHPNAYHMRAECLLEAYRRASARVEVLREAATVVEGTWGAWINHEEGEGFDAVVDAIGNLRATLEDSPCLSGP